ncbi:two-component system, NtrC family, response regulator HydG [Arachidicoccus rhizosphaerae]|uniref:Two-component system, NtrC family, response regulator HydG n=1 Tax=Arachidicoccus rhizosphaerae TaxID=551991 RepID=A0A1H3YXU2_9BACT|nr:sigma-54 dependent transcriptional regulator [Arachidicoccus rhizosphaerae]SEA16393.1 two-component system, NtrC family, response regulator HydG [Arachidicoccus rhizosphaerae]
MLRKILILDKDLAMCQKFSSFLRSNGFVAASTSCNKEALQLIKASDFDLILCDSELKNTYPVDFLLKIKKLKPGIPIISISDSNNVQTAVELMKSGAFYFMLKPINPERLLDVVESALKDRYTTNKDQNAASNDLSNQVNSQSRVNTECDKLATQGYPYITGVSEVSKKLYKSIDLVAPTNYTVIIHGETGTGKESVARMIHEKSKRKDGPFLAVDCGSLSKELAASELFGHEKGAFTGALQTREGAFALAHGGTLFLDEIGNLSYGVQLFLLRAIQERVVRKVGSTLEKPVDVRLIVASNEDLSNAVVQRKFREDLYHRLNEFSITVPALRDRRVDLPMFVESFVTHASRRLDKNILPPVKSAMEILETYSWPGNIRELLNTIKKACLFTPNGMAITEQYLPDEIKMSDQFLQAIDFNAGVNTDSRSEELKLMEMPRGSDMYPKEDKTLKDIASSAELNKIMHTLRSVKFNKSKAAEILNIDRKTLYNKLKKINV